MDRYNYRIGDLEVRRLPNQEGLEVVKWSENKRFGKKEEYLEDGWVEERDRFVKGNVSFSTNYFSLQETCYVIASVSMKNHDVCIDLVGTRYTNLTKKEGITFHDLVKAGVEVTS